MWFGQAFGLPLHVLVNHAVIVFVPLTVIAAVVFVVLPPWRWAVRWPMLGLAVLSLVSAFLAWMSGLTFFAFLNNPPVAVLHRQRGIIMWWLVVALFVITLLGALFIGGRTRMVDGHDRKGAPKLVQIVIGILLVVVAVLAGIQVVLTGDAGARAVWGSQQ
jgi:hypothetical protein